MEWLFQKETSQITIEDLREKLSDLPEGFYMEYKGRETIDDNDDIAKGIAAFANTYGGWLFIGIDTDDQNKPLLDDDDLRALPRGEASTERIQQIAQSHLAPGPHLTCVRVPLDEDDANSDVVLGVYVEESDDPPLIRRRDGCVYTRDGDVSEPVRDRAQLDRLYEKAAKNQELVRARLARHNYGQWLVSELRDLYAAVNTARQGAGQPRVAPAGRHLAILSYPWSPSFRAKSLIGSPQDILGGITEGKPALVSLLGDVEGGRVYHDQYTATFLAARLLAGLQVDVYGHIAFGRLLPSIHSSDLRAEAIQFHEASQAVYLRQNYYGRVGLVYRFGEGGADLARLERTVAAPEIGQIDVNELVEEAARALGERDQAPWRS